MNQLVESPRASSALALSDGELLKVLQSSLYPGAAPESIKMVLGYCKAAGLDPMQKPVHSVPMWDSKAGAMRDVVMPGVNLYRTQASRSNQMAGIGEPEFGPMIDDNLGNVDITYPEWCKVTVRRLLPNGVTAEFSAIEYWIENYAIKGGKEKSIAPNAMWLKHPRGQIAKCAEAQALRKAFPEIGSAYTAEEMEGKAIQDDAPIVHTYPERDEWIAKAMAAKTLDELSVLASSRGPAVAALQKAKDTEGYSLFVKAVQARGAALKASQAPTPPATTQAPAAPATAPAQTTAAPAPGTDDPWMADLEAAERGNA